MITESKFDSSFPIVNFIFFAIDSLVKTIKMEWALLITETRIYL